MARGTIAARFAPILDLLLPRMCVSCEEGMGASDAGLVCGTCWSRIALLPYPQCARCGHPRRGDSCRLCGAFPPWVRSVRSVCWMPHPVASAIVHALKYHEWTAVAGAMAERMARLTWPDDVVEERAAVVPVPLAPTRERERGYNQAALLARALAARWNVECLERAVDRDRTTKSQTRLTPAERSANVHRAFSVTDDARARIEGKHLVLIDDVLTTGATLNACADALFEAGARIVSYATFGRARTSADSP